MTMIVSKIVLAESYSESDIDNKMMKEMLDPKTPSVSIKTLEQMGYSKDEASKKIQDESVIKRNGFREMGIIDAKQMFSLRHDKHRFSSVNESNPYGTAIKKDLSNIPLSFNFKGISFIPKSDILGWAAANTHSSKGWTGVAEYFNYPSIGVCNYLIRDVIESNAKTFLRADLVTKEVNGKYTQYSVQGKKDDGFLYTVQWYEDKFWHSIECSQMEFSRETEKKMIDLSRRIDNDKH